VVLLMATYTNKTKGNLSDQKYTVAHYLQWRRC
jgi:hypothetical protein